MSPSQRAAAERLADVLEKMPLGAVDAEAAALLRELLAEPVINQQMTTELAAEPMQEPAIWIQSNHLQHAKNGPYLARTGPTKLMSDFIPLYAAPQQPMRCPTDGGECGAGGYCRPEPQQRKPLTPSMQAEVECDCLVAWNASTYGHSAQDTVHPMFLSAFISGYRAAERAHGITGEPT